jgi:carboxypeptidase family protein
MIRSSRAQRGSALAFVLLLLAIAIAVGAFLVLRRSPDAGEGSSHRSSDQGATSAKKPDDALPGVKKADDANQDVAKSPNGTGFTVVCLDAEGSTQPLKDIEVRAAPIKRAFADVEHATTAKTDATGTARFEHLPFAFYDVSAAPSGRYPLGVNYVKDGQQVELVFGKGAPIKGKVTRAGTGEPIAHAWVQIRSDMGGGAASEQIQDAVLHGKSTSEIADLLKPHPYFRVTAETAADGAFSFSALPIGQQVTLTFDHDDFDSLTDTIDVKDATPLEKNYVLVTRTEIYGRITAGENGEPLAGVKVEAGEGGVPPSAIRIFGGGAQILEATTDVNGNYVIPKVARGPQSIQVHFPGYDEYAASFEATAEARCQHDIKLYKAASLSGQVVDSANNPIEGVSIYSTFSEVVVFSNQATQGDPAARTAADGTFAIHNMPVNKGLQLIARHPDYVDAKQENIVLQPGESMTGVQIMMSHGGSITGSVADTTRQPVVGASLVARPIRPAGPPLAAVVSGPDGAFIVNNTPPGVYEIEASAPGFVSTMNSNIKDVTTGVQFVMVKEAVYSGRVVLDTTGEPAKKFKYRVRPSDDTPGRHIPKAGGSKGPDGKFEINGLAPGDWDFEFTSDDLAPLLVKGVSVKEGETVGNQELRLKAGPTCVGAVKSDSGKPIQAALVRMEYLDTFSAGDKTFTKLQSTTNSNGEFEIKNLAPGRYKIWAAHPMFAPTGEKTVIVEDATQLRHDFDLQRPASLHLVVHDQKGNTVPNATATLFQGDSPLDTSEVIVKGGVTGLRLPGSSAEREGFGNVSDAGSKGQMQSKAGDSGELTWRRKTPGDWTLWVSADGFVKYSKKLTLTAGKETVHEAVLSALEPGMDPRLANKSNNFNKIAEREKKTAGNEKKKELFEKLTEEQRAIIMKKRKGQTLTAEEKAEYKEIRKILAPKSDPNDPSAQAQGQKGKRGKHKKAQQTDPNAPPAGGSNPPPPPPPAGDNGSGGGNPPNGGN